MNTWNCIPGIPGRPARAMVAAFFSALLPLLAVVPLTSHAAGGEAPVKDEAPWWNAEWTVRKKLVITPGADAAPGGEVMLLVRLHGGNFVFGAAKEDGSDLRVLAEDGTTELQYHLERYDALMNEAFLWVRVPEVKAGAPGVVWLYHGNAAAGPAEGGAKDKFPPSAVLAYHFAERGAPARDHTGREHTSVNAPTATEGALVGPGILLFGTNGLEIPAAPDLEWAAGAEATLAVWVKPTAQGKDAAVYTRQEGGNALVLGVSEGVPYVEIRDGAGTARTTAGEPISTGAWRHLGVVAAGNKTDLYVDGKVYGSIAKGLPALAGPALIGSTVEKGGGLAGELDEFQIHAAALPAGTLRFLALSQSGSEESQRLVAMGGDESREGGGGHSEMLEHVMLFGDIAKNMMFDGWIAVACCVVMMLACWVVAFRKFAYLNSIQKGSEAFMKQWQTVSDDLTVLDHGDEESVRSLGGTVGRRLMKQVRKSPIYHLYHLGCGEIRKRLDLVREQGLSSRTLQAIKASLHTGLVRENQRMNGGLIYLTISIAGGPYIGLLGTVVGVMITFAIIAKSGEVEVNSIAPGIASALLATCFGLAVAIPALFIYSYLSSRIRDLLSTMEVFIDEFVSRMAEVYPEGRPAPPVSQPQAAAASSASAPGTGKGKGKDRERAGANEGGAADAATFAGDGGPEPLPAR